MQDVDTTPCPSCKRPNASFRVTCLYCGVRMPNPTAPPPPKAAPQERPDLDQLIRSALTGKAGGLGKLKMALKGSPPSKARPSSSPPQGPRSVQGSRPSKAPVPQPLSPDASLPRAEAILPTIQMPPQGHSPPGALIQELIGLLQVTQGSLGRGDTAGALRLAKEAQGRLGEIIQTLGDEGPPMAEEIPYLSAVALPEAAPPKEAVALTRVELPHQAHPYALVVDGPGDRTQGPLLAQTLGIDGATARMHVVAQYPRAILRSKDVDELTRLSRAVRGRTPLHASVIRREDVEQAPLPKMVVGGRHADFYLAEGPLWLMDIDPASIPEGDLKATPPIVLAIPGTVVIRRFSAQSLGSTRQRQRGLGAKREALERRLQVLDLYPLEGPGYRLVLGITRFEGLGGYVPESALKSMKGYIEGLGFSPGIRVEGPRTCHPWKGPRAMATEGQDGQVITGWPVWEEHTRLCRLHQHERGPRAP